ncbi:MAG: polyprenyl synthetase family protein [Sulfurovum sp.]|nr:polyprenyl synthetase family protein [Sulfurovum sp.]
MLEAVERKISQYIEDLNDADAIALYTKLPHGKRLRAKLILKIAGSSLVSIKTAAIVEMIHAASLLHDDVIDDAFVRRGTASLNAIYGNKTAIMLGDILYSKGFYELNNIDKEVSKVISNAVVQLSLGERNDVLLSERFNSDKQKYLKMIYQKTASLMEASAEAAALLAGKPRETYRTYGRNLGIAFQMIDDLLDVIQTSEQLGKPAMHDYEEGKVTLPFIYLYESLDQVEKLRLTSLHAQRLSSDDQQWITIKMNEYGIVQKCFAEAKILVEEAISLMNEAGENSLENIARSMIERSF